MSAIRYSAAIKADALHQVRAMQAHGYSRRSAVQHVVAQLGCRSETLNAWLRRDATQQRSQVGMHHARTQRLEREVLQLMRINASLRRALETLQRQVRAPHACAGPSS